MLKNTAIRFFMLHYVRYNNKTIKYVNKVNIGKHISACV